jgi:hypothetical protein
MAQNAAGKIIARFNSGSAPESPTAPKGAYAVKGVCDARSRKVQFAANT